MLTILIVDDDEEVRRKAMRALATSDVRLASAADGAMALRQAALLRPDIVICDVDLPVLGGFDVLAALKADPSFARLQVMMLTSHASRPSMRLGMSLGADDYLTKPFTDEELVEAVQGLVRRLGRLDVIRLAARDEGQRLREHFSAAATGAQESAPDTQSGADRESLEDAFILCAQIHGFTSIAEKLPAQHVARLLERFFDRSCDPLLRHGGGYLKLLGDGLVAVFVEDELQAQSAVQRTLLAANAMHWAGRDVGTWMAATFPEVLLPPFRVAIGIHGGEVFLTKPEDGQAGPAPVGRAVNIAARLMRSAMESGWAIAASQRVLLRAGNMARLGEGRVLSLYGVPVPVHEVLPDLHPQPGRPASLHATVPLQDEAMRVRAMAQQHAGVAASAAKDAIGEKLSALHDAQSTEEVVGTSLHGFRILRRLAAGGMATVYLTASEPTGDLVVLKIVPLASAEDGPAQRFVREFSLLSRISHPNVVKIFNQGFGEKLAYIGMEYFENGDLRGRMHGPLPVREVVGIGIQVASALAATHAAGIVHRDLKPENLMVRADGQVVLADFGIAKLVGGAAGTQPSPTKTGDLLGSPSYMSPEHILGQEVTPRSDLYSLGVVLYELCTTSRPYEGNTVMELLVMHIKSPPPTLPVEYAALQPVLDRLMAKKPDERYASADQAESALRDLAARL